MGSNRRSRSRSRSRSSSTTPTPTSKGKSGNASENVAIDFNFLSQQQEQQQRQICYEGESLARLLNLIQRGIESARALDRVLPEKVWLKQQFCIGVNDVTRVLERMPLLGNSSFPDQQPLLNYSTTNPKSSPVQLQVILLASDCNPRWLTKHLPSMASLRKVPLVFVKDNKAGSLRLGELVKLKTTIAIGVKVKGSAVNQLVEEILANETVHVGTIA